MYRNSSRRTDSLQTNNAGIITVNYKDLFLRLLDKLNSPTLQEYRETITSSSAKLDSRQWSKLFTNCFSHHVRPTIGYSKTLQVNDQDENIIAEDNLAKFFISETYIPPGVYRTVSKEDQIISEELSYQEFLKSITANPITTNNLKNIFGTNRISYLLGEPGEGKSIFATRVVNDVFGMDLNDGFKLFPVKFDVKDEYLGREVYKDINDQFYVELIKKIESTLFSVLGIYYDINISRQNSPQPYFIALVSRMMQDKYRLIILIDNLDIYHYRFSKYSFFDKEFICQSERFGNNISNLIDIFDQNGAFGQLGLCVLFFCRTYLYFILTKRSSDSQKSINGTYYKLKQSPLKDVVDSRIKLLSEAIKAIQKANNNKSELFSDVLGQIGVILTISAEGFSEPSMQAIYNMCHHRYRSLIEFLGKLSFDKEAFIICKRLFNEYPSLLVMLYVLNFKKRYTQANEHFPNIFLVDATISPEMNFTEWHKPHQHTYWLKYLILKYVVTSYNNNDKVRASDVVSMFCDLGRFQREFVLLALGSLCTSNEYKCIEIDYSTYTKNISALDFFLLPTERGMYLLGKDTKVFPNVSEFCFSFNYLELVTDDYQLAIPRDSYKEELYANNYKHIIDSEEFGFRAKKLIGDKIKAVYYLYCALFIDLTEEKKLRSGLFAVLDAKNITPNITDIKNELFRSIRRLMAKIRLTDLEQSNIESLLSGWDNDIKRLTRTFSTIKNQHKPVMVEK
ncbi:MAG: hypothetical protein HQL98_01470 [Magnetococcales bacterium]|nr:hypothetical protein [Magnetococcales bacterium]